MTPLIRRETVSRINIAAWVAALVGVVAAIIGFFTDRTGFFRAYLVGFAFLMNVSPGCLLMLMVYYATGGQWGKPVLPFLKLGARLVVLVAVLFIPLLFGLPTLYVWAQPDAVKADPLLQHQSVFLNPTFFVLRAVIYFVVWSFLAWRLTRSGAPSRTTAILGLVVYFPLATLATVDWFMSLEPHWYSTIYGFLFLSSQALTAFAFGIVLLTLRPLSAHRGVEEQTRLDIGNILLTALLTWVYMTFIQFLVIWSGDLSQEIPWYLERVAGGWSVVVLVLLILDGLLPFLLLLSRRIKQHVKSLSLVALLILIAQFIYVYWLIRPAFATSLSWLDIVIPIGIFGIWMAVFLRRLPQIRESP
jgi:hypothetical protein